MLTCIHIHLHIHTHRQCTVQYSGTHNFCFLLYIQWGATALVSAAFGGSVLVGKILLKFFSSSLDEVANMSVCTDVWCDPHQMCM